MNTKRTLGIAWCYSKKVDSKSERGIIIKKGEIYEVHTGKISGFRKKNALAKDIFSIVILCPEVAQVAVPGQFVHILPESFTLRRPISICDIDKEKGTLRIVFIVKGDGTKLIAAINVGSLIVCLAPLGHGFTVDVLSKRLCLLAEVLALLLCCLWRKFTEKKQQ